LGAKYYKQTLGDCSIAILYAPPYCSEKENFFQFQKLFSHHRCYYIFDIIGLEVQDTNGNVLGTVTDVLQPGANDVYVVSKDGEPDQLFAAIEEVVKDIDVENKLMIVDPPEWI